MIHLWPQVRRLRTKRVLQSQLSASRAGVRASGSPGELPPDAAGCPEGPGRAGAGSGAGKGRAVSGGPHALTPPALAGRPAPHLLPAEQPRPGARSASGAPAARRSWGKRRPAGGGETAAREAGLASAEAAGVYGCCVSLLGNQVSAGGGGEAVPGRAVGDSARSRPGLGAQPAALRCDRRAASLRGDAQRASPPPGSGVWPWPASCP